MCVSSPKLKEARKYALASDQKQGGRQVSLGFLGTLEKAWGFALRQRNRVLGLKNSKKPARISGRRRLCLGMPGPKSSASSPRTLHTCPLTLEQVEKLRTQLLAQGWDLEKRPYMHFFGQRERLNVSVYEKGPKVVLQGKGVEEFMEFTMEPAVLCEARAVGALQVEEAQTSEWLSPHFGIDESGKGDLFGPLVIAGAYVDAAIARQWRAAGVQDSKAIGSDVRIRELARLILETPGVVTSVVVIGPERYNALYEKFKNLNRLLAWGHARVIENLLELKPDCPRALSDQFANPRLIQNALMEKGRGIQLEQRTKAESDPAVAAASILARAQFVGWLAKESRALGTSLPKGASAAVKAAGCDLVRREGPAVLGKVAKLHFKTAGEILSQTSCTQLLPETDKCD
jgi:ribonuclease HIII